MTSSLSPLRFSGFHLIKQSDYEKHLEGKKIPTDPEILGCPGDTVSLSNNPQDDETVSQFLKEHKIPYQFSHDYLANALTLNEENHEFDNMVKRLNTKA